MQCAFMGSMVQDLQQESYEKTKQITDLEKVIERCKAQAQTWVEEKQGSYEKTQQIIDLEDVVERYKAKAQTWVEEKQMFESEVSLPSLLNQSPRHPFTDSLSPSP